MVVVKELMLRDKVTHKRPFWETKLKSLFKEISRREGEIEREGERERRGGRVMERAVRYNNTYWVWFHVC